jgi:predicted lipoprotein
LSKWNNFRNALASNASTATINLKFETLQGSTVVATTVYTIRFTTASLAVRAESVSFSSGITF